MKRIEYLLIKIVIIFLLFTGCSDDPLQVDVSDMQLNLKLIRMDETVFDASWDSPQITNIELSEKYKGYYQFYTQFILNNQMDVDDPNMGKYVAGFANDKTMKEFFMAAEDLFKEDKFDPYLYEMQTAFKHFKYYYPNEPVPMILTFQSGFNYKIVPNDTLLGIGLEWYIGNSSDLIKRLSPQAFPVYEKEKMQPEYLVVDAVKGFLKVKYQEKMVMENLLSVMIFYGKIMYLTDAMLHKKSDALKMNYTDEEWIWCMDNEKEIWIFLAENNLLFDSSMLVISKWVNNGPFTNGLSQDSPARVGIWMGWRMVKQYMENNPKVSIQKMMEMEDNSLFLNNYKPGK